MTLKGNRAWARTRKHLKKYNGKLDVFNRTGHDEVHLIARQKPAKTIPNYSEDKSLSKKQRQAKQCLSKITSRYTLFKLAPVILVEYQQGTIRLLVAVTEKIIV